MVTQTTFGRRGVPQPPHHGAGRTATSTVPHPVGVRVQDRIETLPSPAPASEALDRELKEWRRERARHRQIPWRQIALMASLCFGIAAFKLPSSINEIVQWPLYALMAVSFYTGIRRRR